MTDLAQAIVDMTAAAKGRQVARAELDAATERVAQAIVGPLRSGDSVTLYRTSDGWEVAWEAEDVEDVLVYETVTVGVERVTWPISASPNASIHSGYPHPHGANALVIGSAVIGDPRVGIKTIAPYVAGSRVGILGIALSSDSTYTLHLATGEERLRFVDMAPAIVEAFRKLTETQAEAFSKGAETVTRTVVR
jgi:hypothetical protein